MTKKSLILIISVFSLILLILYAAVLPIRTQAAPVELFYTDFGGSPYTGMNPSSGGSMSYVLKKTYGTDFTVEAVINIKSIEKQTGRGVKFILRDCPVNSSGDLEVWIGAYDIWACTNGWKGNGTVSGYTVDPYLNKNITVLLIVKGNDIQMYIDGNMIWNWSDPSFSAGGQTYLEFGGWDAKYDIISIRVSEPPEDPPPLDPEFIDPVPEMGGKTYYVDAFAPSGGNGLTPETAWNSIEQVNAHPQFLPDDQILFRRGCIWEGATLSPKGYGVEGHPITVDSYGEGALPIIDRKGAFVPGKTNGTSTLILRNQSYWTFRNLQISNHNPENPGNLEDVHVTASGAEFPMRHGAVIQSTFVGTAEKRIVRGIVFENVLFEGIDSSHGDEGNCYKYRIEDKSAASGGGALCFRASDSPTGECRAYIDGITVDSCTFHNNGGSGISIQSGWKYFDSFSNVKIRNNMIYNDPDAPLSCTGLYVVSAKKPMVENNTIQDMTNGIGFQLCENVTAQYNVVLRVDGYLELTSRYSGKAQYWDGCGIDADCGCKGTTTFKANYLELCREGSFAFFDYKDTDPAMVILEDNISYNCGTFLYYQCNNAAYDFIVRNNTIIRIPGSAAYSQQNIFHIYQGVLDRQSMMVSNNVFYFPNQMIILNPTGISYGSNMYAGFTPNVTDTSPRSGEPMLYLPTDKAATTNMSYTGSVPGTTAFNKSNLFCYQAESACIKDGKIVCGARTSILAAGEEVPDVTFPTEPIEPTEPDNGLIIGVIAGIVAGGAAGVVVFAAIKNRKAKQFAMLIK